MKILLVLRIKQLVKIISDKLGSSRIPMAHKDRSRGSFLRESYSNYINNGKHIKSIVDRIPNSKKVSEINYNQVIITNQSHKSKPKKSRNKVNHTSCVGNIQRNKFAPSKLTNSSSPTNLGGKNRHQSVKRCLVKQDNSRHNFSIVKESKLIALNW